MIPQGFGGVTQLATCLADAGRPSKPESEAVAAVASACCRLRAMLTRITNTRRRFMLRELEPPCYTSWALRGSPS